MGEFSRVPMSSARTISVTFFILDNRPGHFLATTIKRLQSHPIAACRTGHLERGDKWSVHLAFAALLLWWQPIGLPIPGRIIMFIKLAALIAVAVSLLDLAADLTSQRN